MAASSLEGKVSGAGLELASIALGLDLQLGDPLLRLLDLGEAICQQALDPFLVMNRSSPWLILT